MQYSKDKLIEQIEQGQEFDYLLFYGHKASEDGTVIASCLSQWFPADFEIDGIKYPTAEHFMMAEKARLFDDSDMLNNILSCKTPKEAKAFGRKVRNFDDAIWREHCSKIVVKANLAKFSTHPEFAAFLVATAPKVIVEASIWDRIWGIGMTAQAPGAQDPRQWKGKNLLGFALMEVRDCLSNRQPGE
ncbi:MAG TPA: NADAR family protein [Candidatus Obscuribacter sp.]|nr:NADAR family protein [Candidatus Obscuribacter sp.]HNH72397.1 NADAR family protein [Candidatus Obscuribacter sp.]